MRSRNSKAIMSDKVGDEILWLLHMYPDIWNFVPFSSIFIADFDFKISVGNGRMLWTWPNDRKMENSSGHDVEFFPFCSLRHRQIRSGRPVLYNHWLFLNYNNINFLSVHISNTEFKIQNIFTVFHIIRSANSVKMKYDTHSMFFLWRHYYL